MDFRDIGNVRLEEILRTWYLKNRFYTDLLSKANFTSMKTEEMPTMAVTVRDNRMEFFYNPEWTDKITDIECETTILHECMHLIWSHPARVGYRNPKIANIAMDMVVNEFIHSHASGTLLQPICGKALKLPNLINEKGEKQSWEGITAEYVIKDLCKREKHFDVDYRLLHDADFEVAYEYILTHIPTSKDGDGGGISIDPKDGGSGYGKNKKNRQSVGTGNGGGKFDPNEACQPAGNTGVHIKSPQNEEDIKRIIDEVVRGCKAKGDLPGGIEEALNKIGKPRYTGWINKLKSSVGCDRFKGFINSYRRFNKRVGHITPALIRAKTKIYSDLIVVGVDTSGSMSDSELEECFGVIDYLAKFFQILVIQCDADIKKESIFKYKKRGDWRKIKVTGRGGTEFYPVFDYMAENKMTNRTLVYLTDGCSGFNFDHHGIDTIWLFTAQAGEFNPPFGKIIRKVMG
jgi:predicted metal-dependent peptidase